MVASCNVSDKGIMIIHIHTDITVKPAAMTEYFFMTCDMNTI